MEKHNIKFTKKAIVLLSGGIDSCVTLAMALKLGYECLALSFDYGQRHRIELKAAENIAKHYNVWHKVIAIDSASFGSAALVKKDIEIPKGRSSEQIASQGIPSTYVPGRNTLFLAYAASQAEIFEACEIYFGATLLDYHPYPDCRPLYFERFQSLLNVATKQALNGKAPQLKTPLINMNKRDIVKAGKELLAPLDLTFSCYDPTPHNNPCKLCDACCLREEAFARQ